MHSLPQLRILIRSLALLVPNRVALALLALIALPLVSEAAPANDNFASASTLTLANDYVSLNASNIAATKETGEPNHAGNTGGKSVWWKWTATANGALAVTTSGSGFDTVLGAYTGSSVSSLTAVASNDNAPGGVTYSTIIFNVTAGTTYYVAVDGSGGAQGAVTLGANFLQPVIPTFGGGSSSPVTAYEGQAFSLYAYPDGVPYPNLRWQRCPAGSGVWSDLADGAAFAGTTNYALTITPTLAMNGDQFRCIATNVMGSATSSAQTISVLPAIAPQVAYIPASINVGSGESLGIYPTYTGTTPMTYVWKKDNVVVAGATSANYYKATTTAADAGNYTVTVTNSAGSATSTAVLVTINPPIAPTLFNLPSVVNAGSGESFSFSPTVTGSQPMTFQWKKDGVNVPGATSYYFSRSGSTVADSGVYTLVATNSAGSTTSSAVTVMVAAPVAPAISGLPAGVTTGYGSYLSFSPGITGSQPMTFQWKKNGTDIAGATSSYYSKSDLTPSDSGSYTLSATNSAGNTLSSSVTVTVDPATAPLIYGLSAGATISYGSSLSLYPGVAGTTPMTFQWKKDGVAIASATNSSYYLNAVTESDAGSYTLTATNFVGTTTSAPIIVSVNSPVAPTITYLPASLSVSYGNSISISTSIGGTRPMTCIWKKDGVVISGATSESYYKSAATPADGGVYSLTVTNVAGTAAGTVSVTVGPAIAPTISNLPPSVTIAYGDSLNLSPYVTGSPTITYMWKKDGVLIPGATSSYYSKYPATTVDSGSYTLTATNSVGSATSSAVSVTVSPPVAPTIADTPATILAAYGGSLSLSPTYAGTRPMFFVWKKDGVVLPNPTGESFYKSVVDASDSGVYTVTVTNAGGTTTSSAMTVTVGVAIAPIITSLPGAVTLSYNDSLYLSPTITGTSPMTYQWRKDGVDIPGGTSASYSKYSLTPADSGAYTLVVTNIAGTTTSSTVMVTVNPAIAPLIFNLPSTLVVAYGGDLSLNPGIIGTSPMTYVWKKNGTTIGGATSGSFGRSSATTADSGAYTLTVTNPAGTTVSSTVNVTVNAAVAPVITGLPAALGMNYGGAINLYPTITGSQPMTFQWQKDGADILNGNYSSLYINPVTTANSGAYTLVATNVAGTTTSSTVTITVAAALAPTISGLPASLSLAYGTSLNLSPNISGTSPMAYVWKKDGVALPNGTYGSYYKNLVTTSDGGTYTLTVSNVAGAVVSADVIVTVNAPIAPTLSGLPASLTVPYGNSIYLSASVTGSEPMAYQWKKDGVALPGATGASYSKYNTIPTDSGAYTLTATNVAGTTTSAVVTVTIADAIAPTITQQPASVTVTPHAAASFAAIAAGTNPLTYQWNFNGSPLPGANYSTLLIADAAAENAGAYSLTVTGPGGTITSNVATLTIKPAEGVVLAAAGNSFSLFVKSDGSLWGTGRNYERQLGVSTPDSLSMPIQLATNAVRVAAGGRHSLMIKADGTLWGVGTNSSGQLGDSTFTNRASPVQIATEVVAVSAGDAHSLFIKADGTLWGMGSNSSGQLGNGDFGTRRYSPVLIASNVIAAAAGTNHSLFLKSDGSLWAMGDNYYGELGDGTSVNRPTPVQVAANVAAIAAGGSHSLFVTSDGKLWSMGYNSYGQLGDGTTTNRASPVLVAANVAAIAAGGSHSLFVTSDGKLWSMGYNSYGQLGDGTTTNRASPVLVDSGIVAIAAGNMHSLYLKSDGTLLAMGENSSGALGAGNIVYAVSSPVQTANGPLTTPGAPSLVKASDGNPLDAIRITWSPGLGASEGEVWRNTTNNPNTATLIAAHLVASIYNDKSVLLDGTVYYYWVRAVNPAGASVFSIPDTGFTGVVPPMFLTHPISQLITITQGVTFSASASGLPAPTYQWKKNGVNIPGATGSSYSIASVTKGDAGSYTVVATNSFSSVTSNAAALTVFGELAGDFNGDGTPDTVWSNPAAGQRSLWLMGGAQGTIFVGGTDLGVLDPNWRMVAAADFNADSKPDLLWQNTATGERYIWFMNGTTHVADASLGIVPTEWSIAAAADFSGDGKPDILWQNTSTGECYVWFMNGTTPAGAFSLGVVSSQQSMVAAADFNADGKPDILWQNISTGERYLWLMNGTTHVSDFSLGVMPSQWSLVAAADSNGDGNADLYWQNTLTGDRYVWFMNGTTHVANASLGTVPTSWSIAAAADFNADGKADLFWQRNAGSVAPANPSDLNNDGNPDLLWQNKTTGERYVWFMNGTTHTGDLSLGVLPTQWSIVARADFNADGNADILWQNTTTGERCLWIMNGTTHVTDVSLGIVPPEWSIAAAADFNGDGSPDILWQNTATGERYLWFMNGTTHTGDSNLGVMPTQWSIAATADFNGDGSPDILWQNTTTGESYLWFMNGATHISDASLGSVPLEWSIVTSADFNADGKPDLLWQNTTTGERYLWFMNGSTHVSDASLGIVPLEWSIVR